MQGCKYISVITIIIVFISLCDYNSSFWRQEPKILDWTRKMTQHLSFTMKHLAAFIQGFILYLLSLLFCWCTKDNPASLKPASGTGYLLCNSYYSSLVAIEADMMHEWHRWEHTTRHFGRLPLETGDELERLLSVCQNGLLPCSGVH